MEYITFDYLERKFFCKYENDGLFYDKIIGGPFITARQGVMEILHICWRRFPNDT